MTDDTQDKDDLTADSVHDAIAETTNEELLAKAVVTPPDSTEEIAPLAADKPKRGGRRGKAGDAAQQAQNGGKQASGKRGRGGRASHAKGSSFERNVGKQLSLWLTGGERNNLFNRNVLSGGQWTSAVARGKTGKELNLPGDLAAAHPQAFEFLKWFCIEVKHNNMLMLGTYLLDDKNKSFIGQVITKVAEQSERAGLHWIFIGKQDRRATFAIMDNVVGDKVLSLEPKLSYHWLFNGTVFLVRFADLLAQVDADRLLATFAPPKPVVVRRVIPPAVMQQRVVLPRRPLMTR